MAQAKNFGSGWHGQTLRHRNAKLYGKAGGTYSDNIARAIEKTTLKPAKTAFLDIPSHIVTRATKHGKLYTIRKKHGDSTSPLGESLSQIGKDVSETFKEGVKGARDVLTKGEEEIGKTIREVTKEKQKTKQAQILTGTDKETRKQKEEDDSRKQLAEEQAKAEEGVNLTLTENIAEKTEEENKSLFESISEKVHEEHEKKREASEKRFEARKEKISEILRRKIDNEDELDVRTLSDEELRQLSILKGQGFFFDNEYEEELKRRIKEEIRLKTDLEITAKDANEKRAERLYEDKLLDKKQFDEAKEKIDEQVKKQPKGSGESFSDFLFR